MRSASILRGFVPVAVSAIIGFAMVCAEPLLGETMGRETRAAISEEKPLGSANYLAYGMCRAWEKKNVANSCEVDTWTSRINVTLDTTAAEALETCRDVRDVVARRTDAFEGRGWRLRIENDRGMLLAECGLR